MREGPQGRAAVGTAVAEDPASPGADGSGWAVCLDDLNRRVQKAEGPWSIFSSVSWSIRVLFVVAVCVCSVVEFSLISQPLKRVPLGFVPPHRDKMEIQRKEAGL